MKTKTYPTKEYSIQMTIQERIEGKVSINKLW